MVKLLRGSGLPLCLAMVAAGSSGAVAAASRDAASRCDTAVPASFRSIPSSTSAGELLPDTVGVLIAIDGVRREDVFVGADDSLLPASDTRRGARAEELVPHLHRLLRQRGAAFGAPGHGTAVRAAGPAFLSLPGYHEILTGRFPSACRDNRCPPVTEPTLLDELAAAHADRFPIAAVASWDGVGRAAASRPERVVLSAGRRGALPCGPLQEDLLLAALWKAGARASAFPGHGNYRPDAYTATLGLELLRRRHPRFLFLGLGDTDEHAHRGNYAGYLDALGFADSVVGEVDAELEALERRGVSTLLVVTTDHGRGRGFSGHRGDPASARVWLVASGSLVLARGHVEAGEPLRLADIAPTFRSLFRMPDDDSLNAGNSLVDLLRPRTPRGMRNNRTRLAER